MANEGVLLVGKVGVKDLYEQICYFEEDGEGGEGYFVEDEFIVKISIWFAVDEPDQLQPSPTSLENID